MPFSTNPNFLSYWSKNVLGLDIGKHKGKGLNNFPKRPSLTKRTCMSNLVIHSKSKKKHITRNLEIKIPIFFSSSLNWAMRYV